MPPKAKSKYEIERARNKANALAKRAAIKHAPDVVETLWNLSQVRGAEGRRDFTEAEAEAIASASYKLRSVASGWVNHKRR